MFFFVLILEFVDQNEQKKTTSELFLFQIGLFRSNSRLLHHQNQRLFKLINGLIYGLRSSVSETSSLCYVCRIKCRDVMTQYMLQYMNCRSKYYNKKRSSSLLSEEDKSFKIQEVFDSEVRSYGAM